MLHDLEKADSSYLTTLYDVCVCGSGPAGITVARELASSGKRVLLLEGGGLEYSERSQKIYEGKETGIDTFNLALSGSRLRYFGGTSNHWSGMCGVFAEEDFSSKRYFDLPGWPIKRQEILKHIDEAKKILDLTRPDFIDKPLNGKSQASFVKTAWDLSAPTRFGTKYLDEIKQSRWIDAVVHANLFGIVLSDDGGINRAVDRLLVKNYRGEEFSVRAKQFVLAMGAIENARILLNSNKQLPHGVGNQSGFVGRCYMEHLNVPIGRFVLRTGQTIVDKSLNLSANPALAAKRGIGNALVSLDTTGSPDNGGRLAPVRKFLRGLACEKHTVREFARQFKDFDCEGDGFISSLFEQSPNQNNRVTLSGDVDELGLRRASVNWQLSELDKKTIREVSKELARTFIELDIGRIQLNNYIVENDVDIKVFSHAHQMGTTRMAKDPAYGVVDANCKVFGTNNLYVAGASVFPTGAGINPTFTIVMLALRLANQLKTVN